MAQPMQARQPVGEAKADKARRSLPRSGAELHEGGSRRKRAASKVRRGRLEIVKAKVGRITAKRCGRFP